MRLLTLDEANIPAMERAYARDVAITGIEHHQRAFLDDVQPLPTTEQWSALAEFERASVRNHSAVSTGSQASGLDNP